MCANLGSIDCRVRPPAGGENGVLRAVEMVPVGTFALTLFTLFVLVSSLSLSPIGDRKKTVVTCFLSSCFAAPRRACPMSTSNSP